MTIEHISFHHLRRALWFAVLWELEPKTTPARSRDTEGGRDWFTRLKSRIEPCPYCSTPCECDLVDVGFGELNGVQCGPYHCWECGASEIGPEGVPAFMETRSERERLTHWYEPEVKQISPYANTAQGALVDHKTAKRLYEMGLLDEKAV